jgi:hypothetical protein
VWFALPIFFVHGSFCLCQPLSALHLCAQYRSCAYATAAQRCKIAVDFPPISTHRFTAESASVLGTQTRPQTLNFESSTQDNTMSFRQFVGMVSDTLKKVPAVIPIENFLENILASQRERTGYDENAWYVEVTHDGVNPGNLGLILKVTPK